MVGWMGFVRVRPLLERSLLDTYGRARHSSTRKPLRAASSCAMWAWWCCGHERMQDMGRQVYRIHGPQEAKGKLYDDQSEAATMPGTHTYTTACISCYTRLWYQSYRRKLTNKGNPLHGKMHGQPRTRCLTMMLLAFRPMWLFRKRVVWEISASYEVEKRCAIKCARLFWLIFKSRGGLHVHRLGQFF